MPGDITRFTFRPKKHYRTVNQQQGRVGLDADSNEQAEITSYRTETEALDVIGPSGAPKHFAGFAISNGSLGNFAIGPGRLYVDGILCENEEQVFFTKQPDWPVTAALPPQGRYIVYLDVWQRDLTALDDPEIREVALDGPDTATRTKILWQVKAVRVGALGVKIGCASEPSEWKNVIQPSTGKLSARAKPDAQSDKPCIVPPGAGYRRLENQLYRVEIHQKGDLGGSGAAPTFKWSRDNGSRDAGIDSITGTTITLTTFRQDSALGFVPGQWIEILDAGQELRGEPGPLVRITSVDDLVLTVDPSTVIGTYPTGALNKALVPKIRGWDSAPGAATATIPSTNDGFIALEDGVEVKFEPGSYRTGDYWTIPARTNLADVQWPQDTSSSLVVPKPLLAAGIRHHFCRLAIVECSAGFKRTVTVLEDCRRLFPPLTELEDACGCCTKTVDETGAGDYRLIQEAVDSLPSTGGQICVLAGTYAESVKIAGKDNITIIGCRERSVLAPGLSSAGVELGPIIQITGGSNIRLESLFFLQGLRSAVVVLDSPQATIRECNIAMTKSNGSEPAIFFRGDDGLIERNVIAGVATTPVPATQPTLDTSTAATERSALISSTPTPADPNTELSNAPDAAANGTPSTAAGNAVASSQLAGTGHPASGIQLAGGCHGVRVVENVITKVKGQGVTFGNLEEVPVSVSAPATATMPNIAAAKMVFGQWKNLDSQCDDCNAITNQVPIHPSMATAQPTHTIISPLSLWDIHIERNRIDSTGLDGIGVIGFFDLSTVDEFVRVRGLTILGNEITDCLALPHAPIAANWVNQMGYGGIALADVSALVIYDNVIERNGSAQPEQPACGIFILHGDGIDIQRNRILGNGSVSSSAGNVLPSPGRCGGIQIVYALAPVGGSKSFLSFTPSGEIIPGTYRPPPEATGFPALKVHDNIVSAPVGPALSAEALGPVSVVGNQLTSGHVNRADQRSVYAPATVSISNLGVSNEQYEQQLFSSLAALPVFPGVGLDDSRYGERLVNGNVLFANNQCSLDLLEQGAGGLLIRPGIGVIYTSIFLKTLDDIAFQDNQCDCNLGSLEDYVVAHTILFGFSLRATGNRFKESWGQAMYSAITNGHLNTTAHNQSTHCLMVTGPVGLTQNGPNTILFPSYCRLTIKDTAVAFTDTQAQS